MFPAIALACELFVCVTGPSLPGLSIRITTFTFVGATCVEVARAFASCCTGALCSADCRLASTRLRRTVRLGLRIDLLGLSALLLRGFGVGCRARRRRLIALVRRASTRSVRRGLLGRSGGVGRLVGGCALGDRLRLSAATAGLGLGAALARVADVLRGSAGRVRACLRRALIVTRRGGVARLESRSCERHECQQSETAPPPAHTFHDARSGCSPVDPGWRVLAPPGRVGLPSSPWPPVSSWSTRAESSGAASARNSPLKVSPSSAKPELRQRRLQRQASTSPTSCCSTPGSLTAPPQMPAWRFSGERRGPPSSFSRRTAMRERSKPQSAPGRAAISSPIRTISISTVRSNGCWQVRSVSIHARRRG